MRGLCFEARGDDAVSTIREVVIQGALAALCRGDLCLGLDIVRQLSQDMLLSWFAAATSGMGISFVAVASAPLRRVNTQPKRL